MPPLPSPSPLIPDSSVPIPTEIGGYKITASLGEGSMGRVFKGRHLNSGLIAAIKLLSPELSRTPEFVKRFLREARALAKLSHKNIVKVFNVGEEKGQYFLILEYVDGKTLADFLKENGPLPPDLAVDYLYQTCEGLQEAHAKEVIHRDIKPENLMIDREGLIKITDFGLARDVNNKDSYTQEGQIFGSPYYISPEQSQGKSLDPRTDIYSLGATFYHLISGEVPFDGDSQLSILLKHLREKPIPLLEKKPQLPPSLSLIIDKMMEKKLKNRYRSCLTILPHLQMLKEFVKQETRRRVTKTLKAEVVPSNASRKRLAPLSLSREKTKKTLPLLLPLGVPLLLLLILLSFFFFKEKGTSPEKRSAQQIAEIYQKIENEVHCDKIKILYQELLKKVEPFPRQKEAVGQQYLLFLRKQNEEALELFQKNKIKAELLLKAALESTDRNSTQRLFMDIETLWKSFPLYFQETPSWATRTQELEKIQLFQEAEQSFERWKATVSPLLEFALRISSPEEQAEQKFQEAMEHWKRFPERFNETPYRQKQEMEIQEIQRIQENYKKKRFRIESNPFLGKEPLSDFTFEDQDKRGVLYPRLGNWSSEKGELQITTAHEEWGMIYLENKKYAQFRLTFEFKTTQGQGRICFHIPDFIAIPQFGFYLPRHLAHHQWHSVSIEFQNGLYRAFFNQKEEWSERTPPEFKNYGRIALGAYPNTQISYRKIRVETLD
jgi:serine/threonine protein kinase